MKITCQLNLQLGLPVCQEEMGGQGKIRLVGLVVFVACVVEGGDGGEAAKVRSVGG